MQKLRKSPLEFVKLMWKLTPERDNLKFEKGKHITWHQEDVLLAIEEAMGGGKNKLSVASGNNIGKSCLAAWVVLWFLFSFKEAQVSVTSPSQSQLYDVLWKELRKWINEMPKEFQLLYDWQQTHIRMIPRPHTWFARAATARKETPEAFSGLHGEHVLLVAEEASGIDDLIFETAEGILAAPNALVLLISNPTRTEGYFYETFKKESWKTFNFSSTDSPIVPSDFVGVKASYGLDSDEYRVFVLGQFPHAEGMDKKGYISLLLPVELRQVPDDGRLLEKAVLGVDVGGEGKNETIWVLRDQFRAKLIAREQFSTAKSVAEKTITLMSHYRVNEGNVFIDNFGVGANVAQEIALAEPRFRVQGVNVGGISADPKTYLNLRAEAYLRLRDWLRSGGELVRHDHWKQLLDIKYKRTLSGKYQIISKLELQERGISSPDCADALMLSFLGTGQTKTSRSYPSLSEKEIEQMTSVY